jgi:hypothetical protein
MGFEFGDHQIEAAQTNTFTQRTETLGIWLWVWLVFTGVATVGWLATMAWAAVALAQWFLD